MSGCTTASLGWIDKATDKSQQAFPFGKNVYGIIFDYSIKYSSPSDSLNNVALQVTLFGDATTFTIQTGTKLDGQQPGTFVTGTDSGPNNFTTPLDLFLTLPIDQNTHSYWVKINFSTFPFLTEVQIGIDTPFGQGGIAIYPTFSVPPTSPLYRNLENFRFDLLNFGDAATLNIENVWFGTQDALNCAKVTPDPGNPQICSTLMSQFCQKCSGNPICNCYNFQFSKEWEQLKDIPTMPRYQCWASACNDPKVYVPPFSGSQQTCPKDVCLQIIEIGKSNVKVQDSPIYQQCGGKPTPGPSPGPSPVGDYLIWIIVGVVVFILLLTLLFFIIRRK